MNAPILVIINPASGQGKGLKTWGMAKHLLIKNNIAFDSILTTKPKDATLFTIDHIKQGSRTIIVLGGDGTLNEVVNGIMQQAYCPSNEISLGIIPNGTGNDFARTLKITSDINEMVSMLRNGRKQLIDIGQVSYNAGSKDKNAYFINMLGYGFDVSVTKEANALSEKGFKGILGYLFCMIKTVIYYKKRQVTLNVNGKSFHFPKAFSICIANGIYHGGGVRQAPNANPSDGIFHATILHTFKNIEAFLNLPKFYSGKFLHKAFASEITGTSFELLSEKIVEVELDGELLGFSPKEIKLMPNAINFLIPS